jgi:hypothetical protein
VPDDFVAKSELDVLPRRHRGGRLDKLDVRDFVDLAGRGSGRGGGRRGIRRVDAVFGDVDAVDRLRVDVTAATLYSV